MTNITDMGIRKILDSRGNPTVEVEVLTESGYGIAAAPAGASTGIHEVQSYKNNNIDDSIEAFKTLVVPELLEMDSTYQRDIDAILHEIDGTENFSKLGGNVAVATSLAVAKAAADAIGVPLYHHLGGSMKKDLPRPFGNVIGGGAHAVGGTDIQEFLTIALDGTMEQRVFANATVHKRIKSILMKKQPNSPIGKGDEGAWVVSLGDDKAFDILLEAISQVCDETGVDIRAGIDVAASSLYDKKKKVYVYKDATRDQGEQVDYIAELVKTYNLFSVEDPMDEDDYEGFAELTSKVGKDCMLIGDDVLVTNIHRIRKAIDMHAGNAALIKPNQIGTLTDTFEAIQEAHSGGFSTVISHRSGETTDETIAHLAVAFNVYGIKTGAVGGERIAKLNELIRIEENLI